ncbi:unnamed protein product [Moneuplotes crassus]|uniref:Uncharacterized protein n=1 Tax=Euplotes crassus TaxID=5936 RepID=A0AAD2CZI8_EUPCR|nr:unnamed protein product [Moneuplotes crassus]
MLNLWKRANCRIHCFQTRGFALNESKRLRTVRQRISYTHKDLTNTSNFRDNYFDKELKFRQESLKTTKTLTQDDPETLTFSESMRKRKAARSHTYFRPVDEIVVESNKNLRKAMSTIIDEVERQNTKTLKSKIFLLDHTAEVLENFRRVQEYKIWKHELHYQRERLVALKKESLKYENLIDNYEALYGTRGYLEDTANEQDHYKHQLKDFVDNRRLYHQEKLKYEILDGEKIKLMQAGRDPDEAKIEEKEQELFPKYEEDRQKYEEYKKSLTSEPTPYQNFEKKTKELKNLRIKSFLKDRKHNRVLQKYLESREESDGEQMLIEDDNGDEIMEIEHEENPLGYHFNGLPSESHRQRLAREIEEYKTSLVEQYRELDIHRKVKKGKKAELKELTLHENLNYMKHNARHVRQAFRIFKLGESISEMPEFASAIIHRISKSEDVIVNKEQRDLMVVQAEYKTMLKLINRKASSLDDKNLVDNIYALGKIHKSSRKPINLPKWLENYTEEVALRCPKLNHHHIAFLSKGLRNLKWRNVPGEKKIREAMKLRVQEIAPEMDAYSISKFMSYLLTMNDIDTEVISVVQDRLIQLAQDGRLDDLETWDFKDILELNSLLCQEKNHFIERICDQSEEILNNPRPLSDLELRSQVVMNALAPYILHKISALEDVSLPFKVNDLAEILYCYSNARQFSQNDIFELMSDKIANSVILREDYVFPDVMKTCWAVSKFYTSNEIVNYNADVSSIIYPRHEYAKVKSIKHRNFDKLIKMALENKEEIQAQYLPMTLYALANVGFTDKEFFDGAILSLIPFAHNLVTPEDIGYIMQAMAMSGLTEYNKFFEDTLSTTFSKILSSKDIKQELSIGQIFCSMAFLNVNHENIENFDYNIGNLINLLPSQISEDHVFMIPPMLWGLVYMKYYDEDLFTKSMEILNNSKQSILKSDTILLNQVFNELRSAGLLKRRDFSELQQLCREQSLKYDDELYKKRRKEIISYKGRDIEQAITDAHIRADLPLPEFHVPHYDLGYTSFLEYGDKLVFLVDPMIKNNDNQLNGYQKGKLQQISEYCYQNKKQLVIKDVEEIVAAIRSQKPKEDSDKGIESVLFELYAN